MSGPFYGSLAASASVFVAILTALLVNNYVQIKSDRRQVTNELSSVKEELKGLKNQKETYSDTVEELESKREDRYKAITEQRVDKFIEEEIPGDISTPIEELEIIDLYQKLAEFYDCEKAEELDEDTDTLYHREALKNRMEEIENKILYNMVHSFATDHRGDGWDSGEDDDIAEAFEEPEDSEEENDSESDADKVIEVDFDPEDLKSEPLSLDEFIDEYKEEYGLDDLEQKTRDILEIEYNEVVDQNPMTSLKSTLDSVRQSLGGAGFAASQAKMFDNAMADFDQNTGSSFNALTPKEQRDLDEAEKDLWDVENQIDTLERTKKRLERQEKGLHPEDLVPTLVANVATIILSVVVPIIAYLLFVTNTAVIVPGWLWIISHTEVNIFLSWLAGLGVVFESIHARMNDREPKAYSLYLRLKSYLPQRFQ